MTSEHTPHPATLLRDEDAYTDSLIDFVTASPSSYHAAAEAARRLEAAGFRQASEKEPWQEGVPARGYVIRDGALIAWMLPERLAPHERYLLGLLAAQLDGGEAVPPITTVGFEPEHRSARYGTARPH